MNPNIVIELDFVAPSPNVKWHWTKRAEFNRNVKWWVRSKCPARMMQKARIVYTRHGRMMDDDNLAATAKAFMDALKGWVIPDDRPDVAKMEFRQVKGKAKTVIEIWEEKV